MMAQMMGELNVLQASNGPRFASGVLYREQTSRQEQLLYIGEIVGYHPASVGAYRLVGVFAMRSAYVDGHLDESASRNLEERMRASPTKDAKCDPN